jgi:phage protein D
MNITELTTNQLNQIIAIKEQIEALEGQIESIAHGGEVPTPFTLQAPTPAKRKYRMSAAHRRKLVKALAKARKIRWAKMKAAKKKDRRSSPAVRAKLRAAARARWAKVRAEGKKTL